MSIILIQSDIKFPKLTCFYHKCVQMFFKKWSWVISVCVHLLAVENVAKCHVSHDFWTVLKRFLKSFSSLIDNLF